MILYFLILFITGVFSLFEIIGLKSNQRKISYVIFCFILFILSIIRWETGSDWDNYYEFFVHATDWGDFREFEPLYATLNTFAYELTESYTFLLLILAIILFSLQSLSISRYSPYPLTSLFCLVGISCGNIFFVRQTVAVAILFYSVKYIQEKKFLPFILFITIATLLHRSSFIFIIAWFVYYRTFSIKFMLLTISASLFLSTSIAVIMQTLGSTIGGVISSKISQYMSEGDAVSTGQSYFVLVLKGVANKFFIFASIIYLKYKIEDKDFNGYSNLFYIGTLIYFATMGISIVLVRFSFPYDIFQIIIIPYIFKHIKIFGNRIIIWSILSLYLSARLYMFITAYYDLYVPYKTIITE